MPSVTLLFIRRPPPLSYVDVGCTVRVHVIWLTHAMPMRHYEARYCWIQAARHLITVTPLPHTMSITPTTPDATPLFASLIFSSFR